MCHGSVKSRMRLLWLPITYAICISFVADKQMEKKKLCGRLKGNLFSTLGAMRIKCWKCSIRRLPNLTNRCLIEKEKLTVYRYMHCVHKYMHFIHFMYSMGWGYGHIGRVALSFHWSPTNWYVAIYTVFNVLFCINFATIRDNGKLLYCIVLATKYLSSWIYEAWNTHYCAGIKYHLKNFLFVKISGKEYRILV